MQIKEINKMTGGEAKEFIYNNLKDVELDLFILKNRISEMELLREILFRKYNIFMKSAERKELAKRVYAKKNGGMSFSEIAHLFNIEGKEARNLYKKIDRLLPEEREDAF